MPKRDSLTRQLIPFARTALRPLRLCTNIVSLVAHKHSYHNGSTAMIPAAASSSSFAITHNYESTDGIAYPRLAATASLSLAASVGFIMKWGMIKTIKGGGQSPQQLPSLCKSERVGQVGLLLAQVRGRCMSEASEKEIKELSENPLKILDRPWFYPIGVV